MGAVKITKIMKRAWWVFAILSGLPTLGWLALFVADGFHYMIHHTELDLSEEKMNYYAVCWVTLTVTFLIIWGIISLAKGPIRKYEESKQYQRRTPRLDRDNIW